MYFSGKITNSFFVFLNRCEFDTSRFFEMTPLEIDFLKDPHAWMEARQVERLLNNIQKAYSYHFMDKDLITTVGHNCVSLKCWGGLEDFLKMFESPEKIHEKLDVFFSYFISPVFKVYSQMETTNSVCFEVDFNSNKYPVVTYYFKAVLEALPLFSGGELTEVKWQDNRLEIFYPEEESLLLPFVAPETPPMKPSAREKVLLEKIQSCEKNLKALRAGGSMDLLDQVLKNLQDLKKELKKGGR